MSDDDRIATLIKALKDLQVQEANLLRQIEEAYRQRRIERVDDNTRDNDHTERDTRRTYQVGDRVYVASRVRRPVFAPGSWTSYNERQATVTKVVGEKVYIKTDNETETWRATKNLRPLFP
jgi:hypothetical protein